MKDFEQALEIGTAKKALGTTNLNSKSSRSHTIFKIIYRNNYSKNEKGELDYDEGSLSVVDLAGAERANKAETEGKGLKEACKINQSLMTLGKCLEALKYNSNIIQIQTKKKNVPFRECKITMYFQEFLISN